jgi:hypothetical protein
MFFEGKNEEPVKIDGTLVVYAFDESNREANNSKPDRKFVFTPDQLPAHYSKSKIGHSYSVWLPWDEIGGVQKEFTLIVRFQPKEGTVAVSDPVRQLLPGKVVPTPDKSVGGGMLIPAGMPSGMAGGVQPAAYQTAITDGTGVVQPQWQQRRLTTTTIDLPSGSTIRSELSLPKTATAAGYYQPAAGSAPGQNYPAQNYPGQNYPVRNYPQNQPQNYPPQGFAPAGPAQTQPPANQQGLQLRSGFGPGRQWPLGEPLARLNRDRGPTQPLPAGSPSGPAFQPGQGPANATPAGPQGGSQWPN